MESALVPRTGHQVYSFTVLGNNLDGLDQEAGVARLQRVPPTERRGRVHTSSVTVAVMAPIMAAPGLYEARRESDFELEWFNGTVGAGGQFRNKTATALRLKHRPTGLVQTAQTRSRENSLAEAKSAMSKLLDDAMEQEVRGLVNSARKAQIGSGLRASERRRTYRFQEDRVIDHVTDKSARASFVMRGHFEALWR